MSRKLKFVYALLTIFSYLVVQPFLLFSAPIVADEGVREGIPINSELVRKACVQCHESDAQNRMSRISYRRTTPEGWQLTLKRMVSLNETKMEPEEARLILKYLANNLGLAPEEARSSAFQVERRLIH